MTKALYEKSCLQDRKSHVSMQQSAGLTSFMRMPHLNAARPKEDNNSQQKRSHQEEPHGPATTTCGSESKQCSARG